ncbi:par-3 family cell polarity regulator beta a [Trichomycterus rosablanca]|uniref:par-3 family cell polarity regulator beta a n=1 Tax=Trichomycterus rosablanca TaxID=2290929 RepID=UPI002F35FB6E
MKVTVSFGRTGVVVPCKRGWMVRDLIHQATQRYRKLLEQDGEFLVRTHHVEYADGGILDPDDMLTDLLEDKDKLIAVYEETELQRRGAVSPGESSASGYSSPYASEPELGTSRPGAGTEIEVTSSALKSNTPLMVRCSSELVLPRSPDFFTREAESYNSRPTTTGVSDALTVRGGTMDTPRQDHQSTRVVHSNNSKLTRTVEIFGEMGPLGIKVVPYCSSLSGRTLGLHVKGIEENSRTKKEGIFQEDECIVQINNTQLIDKSFSESQEVFRQAMSSSVVQLEVLPASNKLRYEKSLIGQIFNGPDSAHTAAPKPKSPLPLRAAPSSPTGPKEVPAPIRRGGPPDAGAGTQAEWRRETPPLTVRASPTPKSRSESPASAVTANRKGDRKQIDLTKGPDGLGFTVVTRDSSVHGPGPILVKSILSRGAAVRDGRLQSGDRILEVNGVDISGYRQEELVSMLRSTRQGETVSLMVSRQEELFLPRELKGEPLGPLPSEDGREQLTYEIPLSDSGSAGLGLSLKGNKSRETGEDLGIFVKSIIHGGAASKDGRLRVNDQLMAVNGESLIGRSNHDAMETLRRSMSTEGNLRGTIQLVIRRALDSAQDDGQSPSPSREGSPSYYTQNSSNGISHPPMVMNSIYECTPASGGRFRMYEDDYSDDFSSYPSDLDTIESDYNPQQRFQPNRVDPASTAGRPAYNQHPHGAPEAYRSKASKSMDQVPDENNVGAVQSWRPAPSSSSSSSWSLGPTLGLQKSSSLESLQTAMEEASRGDVPFRRPAGTMVRGRGCNMSFRQAIDKSYDGPSEPEDDFSDYSSGRDTPASGSSRQELDDGTKEKSKKTKKEKKRKTKKKDDGEDPEKKSKKKGFSLLRFGKKNKEAKAKLGSLSEEELERNEAELSRRTDLGRSTPNLALLPDIDDDDYDPNYARINHFRDPPPAAANPYPTRMPGANLNISTPGEDPREGLYAKVTKIKPASPTTTESNEARLQQIRNQLHHVKPAPSYPESGAAIRLQEYDPSRIRGPDPRVAPRYEEPERYYTPPPRRPDGQHEAGGYLNPGRPYSAGSNRHPVPHGGPYRSDAPPPAPGQREAPSYESAIRNKISYVS